MGIKERLAKLELKRKLKYYKPIRNEYRLNILNAFNKAKFGVISAEDLIKITFGKIEKDEFEAFRQKLILYSTINTIRRRYGLNIYCIKGNWKILETKQEFNYVIEKIENKQRLLKELHEKLEKDRDDPNYKKEALENLEMIVYHGRGEE